MSKLWMAAAAMAGIACATPAAAQRVWQNGRWVVMPQRSAPPMVQQQRHNRWQTVNGRWDAGYRAPGGWNAYRRLNRGASLPSYWMGSSYRIPDYLSFGLAAPPRGYSWVRYYDDAVLVDGGGRVWDSVGGIGWYGGSAGAGYAESYASAQAGGAYAPPPPRIESYEEYDQDFDRHDQDYGREPHHPPRHHDDDRYGYEPPMAPPIAPPPPVEVRTYGGGCPQVCAPAYQGGAFYGGNYQPGTYYGPGGAITTVVVIPGTVTTTTTVTEEVIERTSYVRSGSKRVLRRHPVKYRPRCACR